MREPPRFNDATMRGVYSRFSEPPAIGPVTPAFEDQAADILKTDVFCYDTETSDADRHHAQIFQFACVRADQNLAVHEQHEVRIRRMPHVVPAPEALAITGLSPEEVEAADRDEEFEGARRICALLDLPPGVTSRLLLTFNGHAFDDPLIANVLERNLLDPDFVRYPKRPDQLRRFRQDGGMSLYRIDVLCLARLAAALEPGALRTDPNDKGVPDMRLAALCRANGIPIRPHDACADALATLDLARLIKERAPASWAIARRNSCPSKVVRQLEAMRAAGETPWLFRSFGQAEVLACWTVRVEGGRAVLAPLDHLEDPEPAEGVPVAYCPGAPLIVLKTHMCPYILTEAEAARFVKGTDLSLARCYRDELRRGDYADRNRRLLERLDAQPYAALPDATSEERHEWPQHPDVLRRVKFLRAETWDERAAIEFDSPRLRDFAARLVSMHCPPEALRRIPRERLERIRADCAEAFRRPFADGRWMNLGRALASPEADAGYRAWAERAFDPRETHPGLVPAPDPAEAQPSFVF